MIISHRLLPVLTICLLLLPFAISKQEQISLTNLNQGWEFEVLSCAESGQELIGQKFSTNLPSTIHLDLLKHKKI